MWRAIIVLIMLSRIEVHVVIAFTRIVAERTIELLSQTFFRRKICYTGCIYRAMHNLRSIHDEREWNSVKAETTFV